MKLKHKLLLAYFVIGALCAVIQHFSGSQGGLPWGTSIGHGLVWPAVVIPGLGNAFGGLLIIGFVAVLVFAG